MPNLYSLLFLQIKDLAKNTLRDFLPRITWEILDYNIELAENIRMVFFLKYRNIIFSIRTNLWSSLANIMPFGDRSMQNCTFSCDRTARYAANTMLKLVTARDICQQKGKSKLQRFKIKQKAEIKTHQKPPKTKKKYLKIALQCVHSNSYFQSDSSLIYISSSRGRATKIK